MKTKRQSHSRGWKQVLSVLLVFALAAGLVLGMPVLSGVAYAAPVWQAPDDEEGGSPAAGIAGASDSEALDLTQLCSVTVKFPETMTGEKEMDLDEGATAADLYLVAPAVRLSGYDVYAYCIDSGMPYYDTVKDYLDHTGGWRVQQLDNAPDGYEAGGENTKYLVFRYAPDDPEQAPVSEQEGLAELLAKVFFAPELLVDSADAAQAPAALAESVQPVRANIGELHEDLSAGLYLNVVHGAMQSDSDRGYMGDWQDYVVLVQSDDVAVPDKVCTIAYSDTRVYTFQPQLLSLPSRTDANGNLQADTTQPGVWTYRNVSITAKGEGTGRFADLEITKNLTTYNAHTPITFVFRVTAYDPDDMTTPVYEKVIPLTFSAADTMTSVVITNKIPVGSTVVITEEYSGVSYQFSAANVTLSRNDGTAGNVPGLEIAPAVDATSRSVTIERIPAGRIHLTAPLGEEKILPDGTTETVIFTNSHDDTDNGGGSVVNSFTQDENNGWTWTQRRFDPETLTWVSEPATPVTQAEEG